MHACLYNLEKEFIKIDRMERWKDANLSKYDFTINLQFV